MYRQAHNLQWQPMAIQTVVIATMILLCMGSILTANTTVSANTPKILSPVQGNPNETENGISTNPSDDDQTITSPAHF